MTLKITTDNISTTALQTLGGGVKITSLTYPNSATAADPAGSETITVNGSGFLTGAKVYIDTTLCTTTYVSATSLTFTSPAKSIASYHLFVYNTDGSNGMMPIGIVYSSLPTWVTSSGALTSVVQNFAYSQSVSATGDGTITYSLSSGSLPSGLSLNSSIGAITGTAPNTLGTSNFTITASDSQNQTTSRSFSIQVIISTPTSVEYLVVAGGGGGGGWIGGGGGGGGYRTATGFAVSMGTPLAVTIGGGGAGGRASFASGERGTNGQDSAFSSIISIGGGAGGGGFGSDNTGTNGGSGGGGCDSGSRSVASGGGLGTAGQGNNGGGGIDGSGGGGGGGGGASAAGVSATAAANPDGGAGGTGSQSSITGTATYYAGGGGAGAFSTGLGGNGGAGGGGGGGTDTGATASTGGVNGGNNGSKFASGAGTGAGGAGGINSGGGGGGSDGRSAYVSGGGGAGGSGIVVIRYADSYVDASSTTGLAVGYPVTTGGYKIYKWITSGSITF